MIRAFKLHGPTVVSFSGGRTSALMLRKTLDANADRADLHVIFANTGKEREETLSFIHQIEQRWAVPITWLEWTAEKPHFRVVDFETAARKGEPFEALIRKKRYLPNPVARLCTQNLKVVPMHGYLKSIGLDGWDSFIGIRYDEPRRWKIRGPDSRAPFDNRRLPLADARLTIADVDRFWERQDFKLGLQSWEGNCDLCYLKGRAQIERNIRQDPSRAEWWARMEQIVGGTWRSDRPSYEALRRNVANQPMLPLFVGGEEDDTIPCLCTD